jgi:hypothetical protein
MEEKQDSILFIIAKYVTIGMGIIGIGFVVIFILYLLTHH